MILDLFRGAGFFLRGLRLISRSGVRRYVAIPLIINTIFFGTAIAFGADYLGGFIDGIVPAGYEWLAWLVWPIFGLVVVVFLFFSFTLVANFVAAPFNGPLSAAVERHLSGRPAADDAAGLIVSAGGAILSEVRKLGYFHLRSVPLLVLFLIPGLNLLAPPLWFGFSAWRLAIEFSDFPLGNRGLSFPEQRARLAGRRARAHGFGGAALIFAMIPVLNFFVIPVGVAGATALWLDESSSGGRTID